MNTEQICQICAHLWFHFVPDWSCNSWNPWQVFLASILFRVGRCQWFFL